MQCNINATRWSSLPPRHADKNRVAKKWRVVVKDQVTARKSPAIAVIGGQIINAKKFHVGMMQIKPRLLVIRQNMCCLICLLMHMIVAEMMMLLMMMMEMMIMMMMVIRLILSTGF